MIHATTPLFSPQQIYLDSLDTIARPSACASFLSILRDHHVPNLCQFLTKTLNKHHLIQHGYQVKAGGGFVGWGGRTVDLPSAGLRSRSPQQYYFQRFATDEVLTDARCVKAVPNSTLTTFHQEYNISVLIKYLCSSYRLKI